jgi:hypothetical protein
LLVSAGAGPHNYSVKKKPNRIVDFGGTGDPLGGLRPCDHAGCRAAGEHRAPRSRDALDQHYWFCLDHVRAYNAAWDFYRGMTPEQIEKARRLDIIGWRPTWPLGSGTGRHARINREDVEEALRRFFSFDAEPPEPRVRRRPVTPEEEALAALDLPYGADLDEVKARWKALVKLHHPDANGGDKDAEERLKSINRAYTFLKSQGARSAVD